VEFEKVQEDPFGLDEFLTAAKKNKWTREGVG